MMTHARVDELLQSSRPTDSSSSEDDAYQPVPDPTKPFHAKIDPDQVTELRELKDPELIYNLRLAIEAVNESRSVINFCLTHPLYEELGPDEKKDKRGKLTDLRIKTGVLSLSLANKAKHIREQQRPRVGNCNEYAFLVADYIDKHAKLHGKPSYEIVHLKGGDHVFVIINRTLPLDQLHLDPHAVIADGWGCEAFPATQYKTRLPSYDKRHHTIETLYGPIDPPARPAERLQTARMSAAVDTSRQTELKQDARKESTERTIPNDYSKTRPANGRLKNRYRSTASPFRR